MPTYLSKKALEEKMKELQYRKKDLRKQIAEKIAGAKELGDLSENFEYQESKEEQGFNEAHIAEIESQIHDVIMVTASTGGDEITLGTTFVVMTEKGEKTYSMVGSHEANPVEGKISNESPIGQAFMSRRVGDRVAVDLVTGVIEFEILKII
jgi:transcription elongation factor GreA